MDDKRIDIITSKDKQYPEIDARMKGNLTGEGIRDKEELGDFWDVVRQITSVHKEGTLMSPDYTMFEADPKQKKFITEQLKLADMVYEFIVDKDIARRVADAMIRECDHMAIIERNKKQNFIIRKLLDKEGMIKEENEDADVGILRRGIRKLKGEPPPVNDNY